MSRTTETEKNPCTKYLQWKTKMDEDGKVIGGNFICYDKETKENIDIPVPFQFAIIDKDLVTFKGYNEKKKANVWSNEVKYPEHKVILKNSDGILMEFAKKDYKKNKEEIEGNYAKYTQSVYIGVKVNDNWELWNLQLKGASLTGAAERASNGQVVNEDEKNDGWFSFLKSVPDINSVLIKVEDYKIKKKGVTKFTVPVYEVSDKLSREDMNKLDELDKTLQTYLKFYFGNLITTTEVEPETEEVIEDDEY